MNIRTLLVLSAVASVSFYLGRLTPVSPAESKLQTPMGQRSVVCVPPPATPEKEPALSVADRRETQEAPSRLAETSSNLQPSVNAGLTENKFLSDLMRAFEKLRADPECVMALGRNLGMKGDVFLRNELGLPRADVDAVDEVLREEGGVAVSAFGGGVDAQRINALVGDRASRLFEILGAQNYARFIDFRTNALEEAMHEFERIPARSTGFVGHRATGALAETN